MSRSKRRYMSNMLQKFNHRYVVICDDNRHKICNDCYNKINANLDLLCPICRQHSEDF